MPLKVLLPSTSKPHPFVCATDMVLPLARSAAAPLKSLWKISLALLSSPRATDIPPFFPHHLNSPLLFPFRKLCGLHPRRAKGEPFRDKKGIFMHLPNTRGEGGGVVFWDNFTLSRGVTAPIFPALSHTKKAEKIKENLPGWPKCQRGIEKIFFLQNNITSHTWDPTCLKQNLFPMLHFLGKVALHFFVAFLQYRGGFFAHLSGHTIWDTTYKGPWTKKSRAKKSSVWSVRSDHKKA